MVHFPENLRNVPHSNLAAYFHSLRGAFSPIALVYP
jgi:hypothetical protein